MAVQDTHDAGRMHLKSWLTLPLNCEVALIPAAQKSCQPPMLLMNGLEKIGTWMIQKKIMCSMYPLVN